ncbi:hypothetical protein Tco_0692219 [Tanacetum coccineum]
MSIANQQTLAKLGASDRPSILEKQSYVPWASRFLMFVENKKEERELMRDLIFEDIRVINYILQGIPSDIHNSMDACPDAKQMWARIKMLMQGSDIRDAQEDKITTAMMLLARAITQHYSTPTNNRLRTSSNTRNQAVIQDGRVDIQSKNVGYEQCKGNVGRRSNAKAGMRGHVRAINDRSIRESGDGGHYARECTKPKVRNAKYFREKIVLATKDEVEVLLDEELLDEEENDFLLDNAYGDNTLEELNAVVNASQIDMINGLLSKSDHE